MRDSTNYGASVPCVAATEESTSTRLFQLSSRQMPLLVLGQGCGTKANPPPGQQQQQQEELRQCHDLPSEEDRNCRTTKGPAKGNPLRSIAIVLHLEGGGETSLLHKSSYSSTTYVQSEPGDDGPDEASLLLKLFKGKPNSRFFRGSSSLLDINQIKFYPLFIAVLYTWDMIMSFAIHSSTYT